MSIAKEFASELYLNEVTSLVGILLENDFIDEEAALELCEGGHSLNEICKIVNNVLKENGEPIIECGCSMSKNAKTSKPSKFNDRQAKEAGVGAHKKESIYGLFKESLRDKLNKKLHKCDLNESEAGVIAAAPLVAGYGLYKGIGAIAKHRAVCSKYKGSKYIRCMMNKHEHQIAEKL